MHHCTNNLINLSTRKVTDRSNNNYQQENSINQLMAGDSMFLAAENKFTKLQHIQNIEKEQLTYTIELKEGNSFIANGLLVKTEQAIGTSEKREQSFISYRQNGK